MTKERIAENANKNVPFYMGLKTSICKKWTDYPIIEKKNMFARMDSVFAPKYMSALLSGNLEHVITSRSTGDCLDVFWKKSQNIKSLILLWNKRRRFYNKSPSDRRCYFFITKNNRE